MWYRIQSELMGQLKKKLYCNKACIRIHRRHSIRLRGYSVRSNAYHNRTKQLTRYISRQIALRWLFLGVVDARSETMLAISTHPKTELTQEVRKESRYRQIENMPIDQIHILARIFVSNVYVIQCEKLTSMQSIGSKHIAFPVRFSTQDSWPILATTLAWDSATRLERLATNRLNCILTNWLETSEGDGLVLHTKRSSK